MPDEGKRRRRRDLAALTEEIFGALLDEVPGASLSKRAAERIKEAIERPLREELVGLKGELSEARTVITQLAATLDQTREEKETLRAELRTLRGGADDE